MTVTKWVWLIVTRRRQLPSAGLSGSLKSRVAGVTEPEVVFAADRDQCDIRRDGDCPGYRYQTENDHLVSAGRLAGGPGESHVLSATSGPKWSGRESPRHWLKSEITRVRGRPSGDVQVDVGIARAIAFPEDRDRQHGTAGTVHFVVGRRETNGRWRGRKCSSRDADVK